MMAILNPQYGKQERRVPMTVGSILSRYLEGYFPYFDRRANYFYWRQDPERVIIKLNEQACSRARRMRGKPNGLTLVENSSFDAVVERLANDSIKPHSWVHGEVISVYRTLQQYGFLTTIEAFQDGELAGALLGIDLGGAFIAETMYQEPNARNISKACLCHAVQKYFESGYDFIDVQVSHPAEHPSARIGETCIPFADYQAELRRAVQSDRTLNLAVYDTLFSFCEKEYRLSTERSRSWLDWLALVQALLARDTHCRSAWQETRGEYNSDFSMAIDGIADPRATRRFPDSKNEWKEAECRIVTEDDVTTLEIMGFQVMQSWERPLMQQMARAVTGEGSVVLEIGYGLGICAESVQECKPAKHVIIECNHQIARLAREKLARQIAAGKVVVIEDFWEDIPVEDLLALGATRGFDGIIFDTFPLKKEELRRNHFPFFPRAAELVAAGGRFTYFSDEEDSLGLVHQQLLRDAFPSSTISWKPISIQPPSWCEYWRSSTILLIVVSKDCF